MVIFLINHPVIFFLVSFAVMWSAAYLGAVMRRRRHPEALDDSDDYSLILGSTLTLLGLLIGFTFSMAAGRYDQRKNYEEEEANAIGTEYVRADYLPAADAAKVRALLKDYLALRIQYYMRISAEQVQQNNVHTAELQSKLWAAVIPPASAQPDPVRALVVSGMNDVLNRQGYTQAAFLNRVPVAAWLLMIAIAMFCNFLLGYRAQGKARVMFLILPVAIAISFFLISDIDSPRRGVIMVHPQNLEILQQSLQ
ncbi:MAG TPA: hypothetical protein VMT75_07595 [Candidatus Saccharimonadales bacterium]|nr:hypothetical protein [Candidatus Saccharimonadales bacterium]